MNSDLNCDSVSYSRTKKGREDSGEFVSKREVSFMDFNEVVCEE